MVFLSILGVERIRVVPHRRVEEWLEASGLDWVFLRASYFMQNLSGVHRDDIRLRDEVFLPAGRGRTSFIDVRDVAAVERGVALAFALFMLAEYTVARLGLAGRVTADVQEVLGRAPISLRRFAEDHRAVWMKGESETG